MNSPLLYSHLNISLPSMSSFQFPSDRYKYKEIKNIKILVAMLKDDARKDPKVRITPFKLITFKKYGYIRTIIAQCKYCDAKIQYKGHKSQLDHFNDESAHQESSQLTGKQKIIDVTYNIVQFKNNHDHNREQTSKQQDSRKKSIRNQMILDHYDTLLKEGANHNYIKNQLTKKFNMTQEQSQKIISPFKKMQTLYKISKKKMSSMNFTIIQKTSDMIDMTKVKSFQSSYVEFPNQFTLITPTMMSNFEKYGHTVYFGLYPQYISQSKKLLLVGGFYGINEHHKFVPFANIILSLFKKQEQIIIFNNLQDVLEKEDDEIIKIIMSILKTFFNFYKKIDDTRNVLLVIRQTSNTQAAIYETRKQITNLNFIYCFRQKLNSLELQVNKRYCNDSTSSEQKLDFIISLYTLVKTLDEQEYNSELKSLFKKANTNNTLLLQKITEDSHLFCFCKIKDACNNLYDQCIDDYLKKKYKKMIQTEQRTNHMFMKNIMSVINLIIKEERMPLQKAKFQLKPALHPGICVECKNFRQSNKIANESKFFEEQVPQLRSLKYKICVKTYELILSQLVKCMSIKSFKLMDIYQEKEYFVFKNGIKYKISQQEDDILTCDCLISQKYGIPCCHELFICINFDISIEKQLGKWLLENK